jgi:RimJ/RimL family protein N-acetyltransferase
MYRVDARDRHLPPGCGTARPPAMLTPIVTERLILRPWRDADLVPFAALNADPAVMEFLGTPLDRTASDVLATRIRRGFAERGWGLWAVELPGDDAFIGFTGLSPAGFEAHFTPATEIGWRIARPHWGHGFATEAAHAVLAHGFTRLGFDNLVSFTSATNRRSQRVMERIGMSRDPAEDFRHPNLAPDDALARHVLYRLSAEQWRATAGRLVAGGGAD